MRLSQRLRLLTTSALMCMMLLVATTAMASAHTNAPPSKSADPSLIESPVITPTKGCGPEVFIGLGFSTAANNTATITVALAKGGGAPIFASTGKSTTTAPVNLLGTFVKADEICGLVPLSQISLTATDSATGKHSKPVLVLILQ